MAYKNKEDEVRYHREYRKRPGVIVRIREYNLKPTTCYKCKKQTKMLDLANISGNYTRDINDYRWLCKRCHVIFDRLWEKRERDSRERFIGNIKNK